MQPSAPHITICINDHAYRVFPGSFQKEFAARKQSNSRAYINNLAFNNVVALSKGHMGSWGGGCFHKQCGGSFVSRQNFAKCT